MIFVLTAGMENSGLMHIFTWISGMKSKKFHVGL